MNTTCCFGENDVLFSMKGRERENTYPRNRNREHCIRIVKTSITPFSRAHAYTHITGCIFTVTSVTGLFAIRYKSDFYGVFSTDFNKYGIQRRKTHR